jgi:hypothetical protein
MDAAAPLTVEWPDGYSGWAGVPDGKKSNHGTHAGSGSVDFHRSGPGTAVKHGCSDTARHKIGLDPQFHRRLRSRCLHSAPSIRDNRAWRRTPLSSSGAKGTRHRAWSNRRPGPPAQYPGRSPQRATLAASELRALDQDCCEIVLLRSPPGKIQH